MKRFVSWAAVAIGALFILAACGSANDAAEETDVTRIPAEGAPTEAAQMPPKDAAAASGAGQASAAATPAGGGQAASGGQIAEVTLDGFDIGWTQIELIVTPGTMVKLVNSGAAGHNFEVTELGINVDMPVGEPAEAMIPADAKPGEYEFVCNIPGHAEAGMVGKLIVQEAGAAAAPAGEGAAPPAADAPAGGAAAPVTVDGYDIGWTQTEVTVAPGATINLVNSGAAGHNFEVTELGINVDMPVGETVSATVPADAKPGTYDFICNIPGHAEAGMVGTLTIQ